MEYHKLKTFLMWCTIINGALLVLAIGACMLGPGLWYGLHGKLFQVPTANMGTVIYAFLGAFKIVWLVFNAVPYAALVIIEKK
jgi:hypothetical protein